MPVPITLDSAVETVLGANKKADKITKGLGLETVGDLLRHFPRRYLRAAELDDGAGIRDGEMWVGIGEVLRSEVKSYQDRRTGRMAARLETVVKTAGPRMQMTFFAKNPKTAEWRARRLAPETRGVFQGKVSTFNGTLQLTNPTVVLFGGAQDDDAADTALAVEQLHGVFPIYPLTAGVESIDLLRAIRFAREVVELEDPIPDDLRQQWNLIGLREAFDRIHAPADLGDVTSAQRRFRFEEAVMLQLVLARRRRALREQGAQARIGGGGLLEAFDQRLPFELTAGQKSVGQQLEHDLAQPHPMNRLLQGEVGSGKTLVALRAMLRVVDSGGQAALLAPTEVLAQQHFRSISAVLGDLALAGQFGAHDAATKVVLLTGSMTKAQRTEPLLDAASGEAGIVIGTHALLQEHVQFADLGLVVVDEQHRFGVEQRSALTGHQGKAGTPPHVLVMTATPIPRTVAMTVFGDLEVSTLTELPAGRAAIQTTLVPVAEQPHWIERVWQRVREEAEKGHQAYIVAPRISAGAAEQDAPDEAGLATVEDTLAELREGPLAGLRVEPLHGRLAPDEKDRTMRAFAAGEIDVLVSTTVIEVGVDVANATAMVILDADRFGVSQLHQMRGRVGRGGLPGLCLLVTSAEAGTPARDRIEAVAATTDGFQLAQVDLEQRREGDVLGVSQSGRRSSLQNLRVLRDEDTIVEARQAAETLLDRDATLGCAPLLARAVGEIERSASADYLEKS